MNTQKTVAILLATYNGEKFLRKQLDSFEKQTFRNWRLFVLDDSSSDNTVEILKEYQGRWGTDKLIFSVSPNQGSARTFLTLACDPSIQADYYSYSDQDDIWEPKKIERALQVMEQHVSSKPFIYCSAVKLIDAEDNNIGINQISPRKMNFRNAIIQNVAQGNTIVFNPAARKVLVEAGVIDVPVADWWTYIAVTACDGGVFYDKEPSLLYRLHGNNVIGIDGFFLRTLKEIKGLFKGKYKKNNDQNVAGLHKLNSFMTNDSKYVLRCFEKARQLPSVFGLFWIIKAGIFCQNKKTTLRFYLAKIFFTL